MKHTKLIDELLNELSYRVGIVDIYNKEQQSVMSEILTEWGEFDAKETIFRFLNEEDDTEGEDKDYSHIGKGFYVKKGDEKKDGAQKYKKDDSGRIKAVSDKEYEAEKSKQGEEGEEAAKDSPQNKQGGDGSTPEEEEQTKDNIKKTFSTPSQKAQRKKEKEIQQKLNPKSKEEKQKPESKFPKKALNNKWEGKTTEEIIDAVSTTNDPKVIPTKGSSDVSQRTLESRKVAFGGKAGKGGGDTTIQEEMTNMGREIIFANPNITKEELAEKISERVRQEYPDSKVAQNASKLKKLSTASVAGFGSAKKIQNNPSFDYNPNQPDGYPANTTDGIVVRDTLATQLLEAEKSGDQEAIDHAKNELYEFQLNAADKSITGKEGDADTMVIYKDSKGRDRVCYISNKQSLNDQQSSGTIGSSKKALTFASNRLGLNEQEKQDVLTIAEEQFNKANQFDETFAQGVRKAVETHKEKLSSPQAQKTMAKAAQALTGRSKVGKPNSKLTPTEKKKKESYITDSLKKPEVQAHLLGLEGPPNDDTTSKEYKKWKKDTTEQFKVNGGEYSNEQITHSATMVTGTGGISRGNHLRTNEKITIVSRDVHSKMQKLIDGGMTIEEAASKLKRDFDKPNKKGEVMYGGVFDESDFIEIYNNDGLRDMETSERQRGEDIKKMQTETVSRLVEKDKEEGHTPPPANGKRTQAYVAGFFDRVHITQNVGGTADGRKLTEMGEYSVSPKDYRNALAVSTEFKTEDEWLKENPGGNYNQALENHLIGNVTVEGVEQELHYVSTDGKKKHIGTDTHRTAGKISKVAGQYGKDLQEALALQSSKSTQSIKG
jgi:CBS domain-containing protein